MPGALPVARWVASEGDGELVLYDSGELKVKHDGLEYLIASPWTKSAPPTGKPPTLPPESGVVDSEEPEGE